MSTDFSGRNRSFGLEELYQTLSEAVAARLSSYDNSITRESMYELYASKNKCNGNGNWGFYDRYNNKYDMNDYVGNDFDNITILDKSIGKPALLDKNLDTANDRRALVENACEEYKQKGLCNDFTISGLFPHLDIPDAIISIDSSLENIPCIEYGEYSTFHAKITYCDSCGEGTQAPVPYYSVNVDESHPTANSISIFIKDTLDDHLFDISPTYRWEITENADEISVSPATSGMNLAYVECATLSTALIPNVKISLEYDE